MIDKSERLLIAYQSGRPIRAYRGLQFGDAPMGHKRFEGDDSTEKSEAAAPNHPVAADKPAADHAPDDSDSPDADPDTNQPSRND